MRLLAHTLLKGGQHTAADAATRCATTLDLKVEIAGLRLEIQPLTGTPSLVSIFIVDQRL